MLQLINSLGKDTSACGVEGEFVAMVRRWVGDLLLSPTLPRSEAEREFCNGKVGAKMKKKVKEGKGIHI
jgi:hypothetical protein